MPGEGGYIMKIEIVCKNYRMTDSLENVLNKKIGKLDKYFPDDEASVKVVLSQHNKTAKMEISVSYWGTTIRAEDEGETMYYNIDAILPKIERQILKHRTKIYSKRKQPVDIGTNLLFSETEPPKEENIEIVKVKKFPIEAIEVKEAVENLELIGHSFYLFVNVATNQVEAVYKRHDGTVGLLQPYIE